MLASLLHRFRSQRHEAPLLQVKTPDPVASLRRFRPLLHLPSRTRLPLLPPLFALIVRPLFSRPASLFAPFARELKSESIPFTPAEFVSPLILLPVLLNCALRQLSESSNCATFVAPVFLLASPPHADMERNESIVQVHNNVQPHVRAQRVSVPEDQLQYDVLAPALSAPDEERALHQLYGYSDASIRNSRTPEVEHAAQRALNRERSQRRSLMSAEQCEAQRAYNRSYQRVRRARMTEAQQSHEREMRRAAAQRRRHQLPCRAALLPQQDSMFHCTAASLTQITTPAPASHSNAVHVNMSSDNGVVHRYSLTSIPCISSLHANRQPQLGESSTMQPCTAPLRDCSLSFVSSHSPDHITGPITAPTLLDHSVASPSTVNIDQYTGAILHENIVHQLHSHENSPTLYSEHEDTDESSSDVTVRVRPRRHRNHNLARICNTLQQIIYLQLQQPHFCTNCNAKLFGGETPTMCCSNGRVQIPSIPVPPELYHLFTTDSAESRHFRRYIRSYNHVFAFTSMGVTLDEALVADQHAVYTLRAHGSIYHRIGSLLPAANTRSRYLQLYIYDTEHEIDYRLQENAELDRALLQKIKSILDAYNPFVLMFRQIFQHEDINRCRLIIKDKPAFGQQYTLPSASHVVAIIVGSEEYLESNERHIIVEIFEGHLVNIQEYVGFYDPLQYPLFLPYGTYGWLAEYKGLNNQHVSCCDYYSYILQDRQPALSLPLHGCRLLQQYVVDNYIKIETQKLRWITNNQKTIRSELYCGLQDCLNAGEHSAANIGQCVILSSSFIGSPRDMYQRYQDAMAVVQHYGRPDIFLTMICNASWRKITDALYAGQTPQDRPDVVSRIFHAKYAKLKNDIFHKNVLGKTVSHVHVIEFQKRGLPHVHMLVIFAARDKVNTPDDYDKIVRAELPEIEHEPELYNAVVPNERNSRTMLTVFFHVYATEQQRHKYLYTEFPKHYTWNLTSKTWIIRRRRHKVIGRMYSVYPSEGERFYLRILLNHIRGPRSFEDLLTVDNITYSTFKESAEHYGLLERDNNLHNCMREAREFQLPQALRNLFITIILYCNPTDVRQLWNDNYSAMTDDYISSTSISDVYIVNRLLNEIDYTLQQHSKSITQFDIPQMSALFRNINNISSLIEDELSIPISSTDFNSVALLNPGQFYAFHTIMEAVRQRDGRIFFIDGPGGSGKTFLYKVLLAHLRHDGRIVLATTSSGIAATLLPGGTTAYLRFKIPIPVEAGSFCKFWKQSEMHKLIEHCSAILWDEAPMSHKHVFESVDQSFRDVLNVGQPFGGKVVIMGGDFWQVPPVVVNDTKFQIINASIVDSSLWSTVQLISLSENMRAFDDHHFSEYLLRIGNGDEHTYDHDMIQILMSMIIPWEGDHSVDLLINSVFSDIMSSATISDYWADRALLTPLNEDVSLLNEKCLKLLSGYEMTYYSFDSVDDDRSNLYPQEFLNSISTDTLPPHKLSLKKDTPIMLLRNLNPRIGLCNGSRLICRQFTNNIIDAEILTGQHKGKTVFLPRIPLKHAGDFNMPFELTRKQFPVRLSFAITINKSQGQTIRQVGLYLPSPVFTHGQLYVALSRGVNSANTKVLVKDDLIPGHPGTYTQNVVFKELLSKVIVQLLHRKIFAMSGLNSSSAITCNDDLLISTELEHFADVPQEMRDNYYFCLLLGNLNLRTTSQADVDANGNPVGTGEVIFADEATMTAAAGNMHNKLIDGNQILVRAMTLFDVKPEFVPDAGPTDNSHAPDCDYNYYDDICKPTTSRWSDGQRTAISGFRLRIPAVPPGLSAQEEWNFVFTMIKSIFARATPVLDALRIDSTSAATVPTPKLCASTTLDHLIAVPPHDGASAARKPPCNRPLCPVFSHVPILSCAPDTGPVHGVCELQKRRRAGALPWRGKGKRLGLLLLSRRRPSKEQGSASTSPVTAAYGQIRPFGAWIGHVGLSLDIWSRDRPHGGKFSRPELSRPGASLPAPAGARVIHQVGNGGLISLTAGKGLGHHEEVEQERKICFLFQQGLGHQKKRK
ncbi:hypothetical protein KSP39_PZI021564 [Platanthera zijinensis]|uniref:ATP-dependent DNA helicase n=1 Tax=Platanthera zijinensis TaxID=2320716 RepID=A0AAP0FVX4_9ASPA